MYVGQSLYPNKRFYQHLNDKSKSKKVSWIKSLRAKGLLPILEIHDSFDRCESDFWEEYYISLFKSWGFALKNLTLNGRTNKNIFFSDDHKRKISEALMGRVVSMECKKMLSKINTGKKQSATTIEKRIKKNIGKKRSTETKLLMSQRAIGRKMSDSTKLKLSQNHIGKKLSQNHKDKIALGGIGRKHSPETIKKMSVPNKSKGKIGEFHRMAKIVLDIKTGIYYGCLKDACLSREMNYYTVRAMVQGRTNNYSGLIYA